MWFYLTVENGKESFETAIDLIKKVDGVSRVVFVYGQHYVVDIPEPETKFMIKGVTYIGGMYYDLRLLTNKDDCAFRNHSIIEFKSCVMESSLYQRKIFYEIFLLLCKKIDPVCGMGGAIYFSNPAHTSAVHYRDPYFFFLEPEEKGHKFLYNLETLKKIDEIKKVIKRDELIRLLKKYGKTVEIGPKGGMTVLKSHDSIDSLHAFQYVVCKEIRKRGVELKVGHAEEMGKRMSEKELKEVLER